MKLSDIARNKAYNNIGSAPNEFHELKFRAEQRIIDAAENYGALYTYINVECKYKNYFLLWLEKEGLKYSLKNNDGHTVMIKVYWGMGFIE